MTAFEHRRRLVRSLCLLAPFVSACGSGSREDPALRQAEKVIRHLTSARHLRLSMYSGTIESGKPSELVAYLFSTLGAAEWPPGEDATAIHREEAQAIGAPLVPANVLFRPFEADRARAGTRQLVVGADDPRNVIIVSAYADPIAPPAFVEEWAMPDTTRIRPGAR